MNDGNGLTLLVILIVLVFSYIGVRRGAVDFIPGLSAEVASTTPGASSQNAPLSPPPSNNNPVCNYPPSIPCQCVPASAPIISCQNFTACPTGLYARTVFPGINQLSVGCIYDMGIAQGGYETFMNDPSCKITCP